MNQEKPIVPWSKEDRALHLLPAIPLVAFYIGAVVLLARESVVLVAVFLALWVGINVSVAGICAGCPYRGGYCPGLCQLYFAPFLSKLIYKEEGSGPRSFKLPLALMGVFGIGSYVFVTYWLFRLYWGDRPLVVLALLALLIVHMPLSFFLLCPNCGYKHTCPMAKVHKAFK
jgi:hypothetical protein